MVESSGSIGGGRVMAKIRYMNKELGAVASDMTWLAEDICERYAAQGYDLTLRQLYYQFVAHDLFPADRTWAQTTTGKWVRHPDGTKNADPNYQWLGGILNDARLRGYLDWDYMVDRTRNLQSNPHWASPVEAIDMIQKIYRNDRWQAQPMYVEVWIEKDALVGVLERCCPTEDVPYFSCRGYASQSELWAASQRLIEHLRAGQEVRIIHLGDHDPSGIDMTRDITERLATFIGQDYLEEQPGQEAWWYEEMLGDELIVDRIALNMDQIRRYRPPPNPAKLSDTRAKKYVELHGSSSWELDALEPPVLVRLIQATIKRYRDHDEWDKATDAEAIQRKQLGDVSEHWDEVEKIIA